MSFKSLGYLELNIKNNIIKDKHGRSFYDKPANGQLHIMNRAFYYANSSITTHCNDIFRIYNQNNNKPKILAITCDNGPDFSPSSYLVFFCMGRLWKDLNLDQLMVSSYAPYQSKYNSIEIAWGNMSQALAQVTLVPDANKFTKTSSSDMKNLFTKALEELGDIWNKTQYSGLNVDCQKILPDQNEEPYNDLAELKTIFASGKKSPHYQKYNTDVKFFMRHCVRRKYYLHFRKCDRHNCTYCYKTSTYPKALDILSNISIDKCLPLPFLEKTLYEGQHYPSFTDIITNEKLLKMTKEKMEKFIALEKKANIGRCHWCAWYFKSDFDYKKHRMFCP